MAPRQSMKSAALRLLPLLFPLGAFASFDCNIVRDGVKFDLTPLRGEHAITVHEELGGNALNTTWTTNLCAPLKKNDKTPSEQQCPSGTRICGARYLIQREKDGEKDKEKSTFEYLMSIAGEFPNNHIDPEITRLKNSPSNADAGKEGLRLELHGGTFQSRKQKAIVELICDSERTGWEGQDDGKSEPGDDDKVVPTPGNSMRFRRIKRDDDKKDGDKKDDEKKPDEIKERSLKFISYKDDVLRLEWRTKYACENTLNQPGEPKKGSWGFFTWIVIIGFLGIAAYLIFGSWLNYNRYGARGIPSRPSTAVSSSLAFKPLPTSEKPEISITPPQCEKVKAGDITVQIYSPFSPSSSSSSSSANTPVDAKLDV